MFVFDRRSAVFIILALLLFACSPAADPVQSEAQVVEPSTTAAAPEPTPMEQVEVEDLALDGPAADFNPFEEGLSGGNTDEFPYPATDDAFGFENFGGLVSYMTYYDLDELVMLYQAAMPILGYAPNSDTVIPGMAVLSYEGDGVALTVNIDTNAEGTNKVSILAGTMQ